MVTAVKETTVVRNDLDSALLVRAYRVMLLARATEDKLASLYRAGMIKGGVFLGKGQEALSTASSIFLQKGDIFGPLIRDQAGRLAFGTPCSTPSERISDRPKVPCAGAMATSTADVPAKVTTP